MMKLALLLAVGVIAQTAYCDEPERIVGGNLAKDGQFKHQVSLQNFGEHFCGGSIISSTHILTAAHCVYDKFYTDEMYVVTGTTTIGEGEVHEIKCIRLHPKYTDESDGGWKDDIAVITLKKPIIFNSRQGPIALTNTDHIHGNKRGIISGWGKTSLSGTASPVLQYVPVNILPLQRCLDGHKNPRTNENQICTLEKVGKGACHGDSGGPVIVDDELVGLVSWIVYCAFGISDVHTNIFRYRKFIEESQLMC